MKHATSALCNERIENEPRRAQRTDDDGEDGVDRTEALQMRAYHMHNCTIEVTSTPRGQGKTAMQAQMQMQTYKDAGA